MSLHTWWWHCRELNTHQHKCMFIWIRSVDFNSVLAATLNYSYLRAHQRGQLGEGWTYLHDFSQLHVRPQLQHNKKVSKNLNWLKNQETKRSPTVSLFPVPLSWCILLSSFIFGCSGPSLLQSFSPAAAHGLLAAAASPGEQRFCGICLQQLWCVHSAIVVLGLSCSEARGIILDQGLNPCLLHWQGGSLPLSHRGSPFLIFFRALKLLNIPCVYLLFFASSADM